VTHCDPDSHYHRYTRAPYALNAFYGHSESQTYRRPSRRPTAVMDKTARGNA
jgi:hypothetical protein